MYNKNRNDGRLSMSSQRINIIDDQFFDHKSQLMYVSYSKYGKDWKSPVIKGADRTLFKK